MNSIYNTVIWLKSESTGAKFPVAQFTADTDMATDGWTSLTSIGGPEIVVTQATSDEYRAVVKGLDGYLLIESRVNRALGRSDLRCNWLVGVEENKPIPEGISFQEFLKTYRPPKLWYRDIFTEGGRAEIDSQIALSKFKMDGGTLEVLE